MLPISVALVGYVFGPLLFGPLSETFGRKPILLGSFVLYIVSSAASALAPGWPSFLVSRFLVGTSSAAPYAVVGAMFADLYSDPVHRGRANSAFLTVSVLRIRGLRTSNRPTVLHARARLGPNHLRFHLAPWLEMDVLGIGRHRGDLSGSLVLDSRFETRRPLSGSGANVNRDRDLCTRYFRKGWHGQGPRGSSGVRVREDGSPSRLDRDSHPTDPHVWRADRTLYVHLPCLCVRHLVSLFRGLPHHLPWLVVVYPSLRSIGD